MYINFRVTLAADAIALAPANDTASAAQLEWNARSQARPEVILCGGGRVEQKGGGVAG
jgi:hypothetical protein